MSETVTRGAAGARKVKTPESAKPVVRSMHSAGNRQEKLAAERAEQSVEAQQARKIATLEAENAELRKHNENLAQQVSGLSADLETSQQFAQELQNRNEEQAAAIERMTRELQEKQTQPAQA